MKKHLIRNLFLLFSFLPFIETFANSIWGEIKG